MVFTTELAGQHYFFDYKMRRHGPFDTVEELHEAIRKEAERITNELQQKSTRPLRES